MIARRARHTAARAVSAYTALDLAGIARTAPTLVRQARRLARDTPRLPEARGIDGVARAVGASDEKDQNDAVDPDSAHTYHLVVLGDSVAAGVGLDHHRDSVAGRLACLASRRCGHPVAWHVIARSGATARDCASILTDSEHQTRLASCDAIVLSVGVNDVLAPRRLSAWRSDLTTLLTRLSTTAPGVPVVLLGVPPLDAFPAMPDALGTHLGRRARHFDDDGRAVAADFPGVHHLPFTDVEINPATAFTDDGFHPSAKMHKRLAKHIDRLLAGQRAAARSTP